jgi:hypothetical protein
MQAQESATSKPSSTTRYAASSSRAKYHAPSCKSHSKSGVSPKKTRPQASTRYASTITRAYGTKLTRTQALTILPHLLHTALLALLSASIPLSTTLTSVVIALPTSSSPLLSPTANELLRAKPVKSVHVFAFSGDRRLLLNESDGAFSYKEWEEACEMAEEVCCREEEEGGVSLGGESMDVDGKSGNLDGWLRETMRRKVEWEQRWKSGT